MPESAQEKEQIAWGMAGRQSEEVEQKRPGMSGTTEPSNIYLKRDKIHQSLLGFKHFLFLLLALISPQFLPLSRSSLTHIIFLHTNITTDICIMLN